MKTILFWDTETSGLPLFSEPSEDHRQPHIVQFGARLCDAESRKVIATIDLIAKPDGWTIPDEVAAVHGVTTERAMAVGVPERDIVALFVALGANSTHVAHNSTFDERIVRIALKRYFGDEDAEAFKARTFACTARMATPIMKLPPTEKMKAAKRFHSKTPNLSEAFLYFTGHELQGAHSALADVDACMAVYWAIQDGVSQAVEPMAA